MTDTMQHLKQWLPKGKRQLAGTAAVAVPAIILYLLTAPWPDTPDGLFHLHRVRALAEALRMGVFLPRWFPDFAFGYGYPVLNFYAPAFYYPPALLHLAGLDVITAVRAALAAFYALSGWATYTLLRRWIRPGPAALGALLYLAYPYRLYDLFVRGALPEFAAFLWPPFIAWTTIRWINAVSQPHPVSRLSLVRAAVLAALCWTGLIVTHNLTALMAAAALLFIVGAYSLWHLAGWLSGRSRGGLKQVVSLGVGAAVVIPALGAALSAPYTLPALLETGWVGIGATPESQGYVAHFATWRTLVDPALFYRYPDATQPTVPAPAFVAIVLVMAVFLLITPLTRGRRAALSLTAGLTLATLWLTTSGSAFLWAWLAPAMGKLQFPWRWQTLTALALACTAGLLVDIIIRWTVSVAGHRAAALITAASGLILGGYLVVQAGVHLPRAPATYAADDLTARQMWAFDAQLGQVGATWAGEFLPKWVTEQRWAIGRAPSDGQSGAAPGQTETSLRAVSVLEQSYLGERLRYEASAAGPLIFHTFYYPAWRVEVDGRPLPTRPVGTLGLLTVDLPAGRHEVIRRWAGTPAVWAGRGLAILAWLAVLGAFLYARERRSPLHAGLWLLLAVLAVIGSSGWTARTLPAAQIGADYGSVQLASAVTLQRAATQTVPVTLYWLVTATPEPLTAFVHLVAPDGSTIAGDDVPLGGAHTPASRWQIGQLLPDRHVVRLPAGLAAGAYRLKAGLYRPGAPDKPLTPAGSNPADPRVVVGTLEVRP